MERNAMMIDARDDVAIAIEPIAKGENAVYLLDGKEHILPVLENITIYHKLAVKDIAAGAPISKYGEHIGVAARAIQAGEHIHEHNVTSHRENLDA